MDLGNITEFVKETSRNNRGIIATLEGIQSEYGYLPEEALRILAQVTGIPFIDIYSTATFYKSFSLTPRGKHYTTVCMGTACHVRGSQQILEKIERDLSMNVGETTSDQLFTLEAVNCLGACALGPIIVVNDKYHGNMTVSKTERLFKKLKKDTDEEKVTEVDCV